MNELSQIKFSRKIKIALVLLTALLVGPISFFLTISALGIASAAIAVGIALFAVGVVNALIPATSDWLTALKFKSVQAVATANPIETLLAEQAQSKADLDEAREGIERSMADVEVMAAEVQEIKGDPAATKAQVEQWEERLGEYEKLLAYRVDLYKQAKIKHGDWDGVIRIARIEWRLLQSDARLSKTFQRKDEFMRKLRTQTALDTIQRESAQSRARLRMAIIDGEGTMEALKGQQPVHSITYDKNGKVVLGNVLDVPAVEIKKDQE